MLHEGRKRYVKPISPIEERDFPLPAVSSLPLSRYNFRHKASAVVLFIFALGGLSWARLFRKLSEPVTNSSTAPSIHASRNCKVAIGVVSKASDYTNRDVIRRTWGHPLTSSSYLFFVISDINRELVPHELLQFERERLYSHDLLILNSSSAGTEYAISVEWFSWAAQMTDCETIFKTRDDTYLRVHRLEHFLNSAFGFERPTKKYFGAFGNSNLTQNTFMFGAGYGVSRDVALWISINKNISVESSSEDVGIGNLLSYLHSSSKLEYYTDSNAFGTVCHARSVLDSPLLSNNFDMYIRHQEDSQGEFCAGKRNEVVRVALPFEKTLESHKRESSNSKAPIVTSSKSPLRPEPSLLDESDAPWNRSNRGHYTEDRAATFSRAAYTFLPWQAVTVAGKFGGAGVFEKSKAEEKYVYGYVVEKAKGVVRRVIQKCPKQRLVGTWLKTWGRRKEYIVHLQCTGTSSQTALVHVPFKANGDVEVFSPAYVVGPNRLVMIVPISCRLDTLRSFLRTSGQQFSTLSGRKTKLILAWSYCHEEKDNFTESAIMAVAQKFQQSAKLVEVQVLFFQDGRLFSRSRALNAAIRACNDEDIAVVLDVDVQVKADFFLNCLAFARKGHSMYFPIMFSRFNPKVISTYGDVMAYTAAGKAWLSKVDTISADTGLWRDFSLGMVSMSVHDAKKIGLFDAQIEGWGNEDVEFFERALTAGYMTWRLYETNEVHVYHAKDCTGLKGTDRFSMCLGSKLRMEGNQLQVTRLQGAAPGHFPLERLKADPLYTGCHHVAQERGGMGSEEEMIQCHWARLRWMTDASQAANEMPVRMI
jgi:hypothetical protein